MTLQTDDFLLPGEPPVRVSVRQLAGGRRISLRVDRIGGHVSMTVPRHVDIDDARRFALGKRDWIDSQIREAVKCRFPLFGDSFQLEGRQFEIRKADGDRVRCRGSLLLAHCDVTELPIVLGEFCKSLALERLLAATRHYADMLSLPTPGIRLRDPRSRWGSCSSGNRLMFSWRLIMAPPAVLDYVAAHEVSHLVELNHSSSFWQIVDRLCPDRQAHRKWLKDNGTLLHQYILV